MSDEFVIGSKLNSYILVKKLNGSMVGKNLLVKDIEEELANYCSVSKNMITSIKSGRKTPSLGVALKISEYFGESVNDIFYFKKEEEGNLSLVHTEEFEERFDDGFKSGEEDDSESEFGKNDD